MIQQISKAISNYFPNSKCYGEAHLVITENQGANYVSIKDSLPCSVDDNFDFVYFFVRENATPTTTNGRGLSQKLSRNVTFRLVVNAKAEAIEYNLSFLLNSIADIELGDTNYSTKSIAQTYFGLTEHNFETYFFTIGFNTQEVIDCLDC